MTRSSKCKKPNIKYNFVSPHPNDCIDMYDIFDIWSQFFGDTVNEKGLVKKQTIFKSGFFDRNSVLCEFLNSVIDQLIDVFSKSRDSIDYVFLNSISYTNADPLPGYGETMILKFSGLSGVIVDILYIISDDGKSFRHVSTCASISK